MGPLWVASAQTTSGGSQQTVADGLGALPQELLQKNTKVGGLIWVWINTY
jgi:hypothetical protein